jgi:hypothetical protein
VNPALLAVAVGACVLGATIVLARVPPDRLAFFLVGVVVLTVTWNGFRLAGGSFGNLFLALAGITAIVHVVVDRRPIVIPPWLLVTAAGMAVAGIIVGIFPPNIGLANMATIQYNQLAITAGVAINLIVGPRSNIAALIKFEIALLVLPTILVLVATTPARINRLLDLFTISAAVNAFVGIADYAGFHSLAPVAAIGKRTAGLTVHPNYLALTCALAMPAALRWVGRSRRGTYAGLGVTLILIGGEYATGSRDGNVAAAVGLLLSVAFLPRLRPLLRYVLPAAGVAFVALLAFTHLGHSIINQLRLGGPTASTTGSNYQRSVFAHVAERQISARPLEGVGFSVDNDAQNIYLQILASGGLIAAAAFLVFVGGLAQCLRRSLGGPVREEAIVIGIAVFVWLLNGYYDAQIADKYLYVLPGILIACARVSAMRSWDRSAEPGPIETRSQVSATPALEPVGAGVAAL